ncbi:hypothetical protein RF55_7293 [Lasius niger]|uniref:Uncharacterized protein n=1 Tax=Lasius niger TaxID=67767 RepID=A0A0J7KQN3_LASNI|nr:hypothetical protein RF55_7293 [Lasius niger]
MSGSEEEPPTDHTANPEPAQPDPATVLNQIRKWDLHFDGRDPFAFLEQLSELKRAYGYTGNLLLLGLPELLRGDPLLWYRNNTMQYLGHLKGLLPGVQATLPTTGVPQPAQAGSAKPTTPTRLSL